MQKLKWLLPGFCESRDSQKIWFASNPTDSRIRWIRMDSQFCESTRIQNWIRKSANPCESQDSHGFDESWILSDSGFAKWKFCESMDSQDKKIWRFCESNFLGFARFGVYANPGIRTYANPCESTFLSKLNFANPDSHECESRCESKCKSQSSWVQNYLILCH